MKLNLPLKHSVKLKTVRKRHAESAQGTRRSYVVTKEGKTAEIEHNLLRLADIRRPNCKGRQQREAWTKI